MEEEATFLHGEVGGARSLHICSLVCTEIQLDYLKEGDCLCAKDTAAP